MSLEEKAATALDSTYQEFITRKRAVFDAQMRLAIRNSSRQNSKLRTNKIANCTERSGEHTLGTQKISSALSFYLIYIVWSTGLVYIYTRAAATSCRLTGTKDPFCRPCIITMSPRKYTVTPPAPLALAVILNKLLPLSCALRRGSNRQFC